MSLKQILFTVTAVAAFAPWRIAYAITQERDSVPLIEPLGNRDSIPIQSGDLGVQTFLTYFDDISTFIITVAVGFTVLWILIGGIMIMISGSDSGMRDRGKQTMKEALIGLIILVFAGFFLRLLNDIFFV